MMVLAVHVVRMNNNMRNGMVDCRRCAKSRFLFKIQDENCTMKSILSKAWKLKWERKLKNFF